MRARLRRTRVRVAFVAGIMFSLLAMFASSLLHDAERRLADTRLRLSPNPQPASEVVLCAIPAEGIDRSGFGGWSRARLAELIDVLDQAGAHTLVLDLDLSGPAVRQEDDLALSQALTRAQRVVLAFDTADRLGDTGSPLSAMRPLEASGLALSGFPNVPDFADLTVPAEALTPAAWAIGHRHIPVDADGRIRRQSLLVTSQGMLFPSLTLRAVQSFADVSRIRARPYQRLQPSLQLGDWHLPTGPAGEVGLRFVGNRDRRFDEFNAVDVLAGKVAATAFSGKLVLVGLGPADSQSPTLSRLQLLATATDNLLHRRFIRRGPLEGLLSAVAVFVLGIGAALSAMRYGRSRVGIAVTLAMTLGFLVAAEALFLIGGRQLPVLPPLLAAALSFTVTGAWRYWVTDSAVRRLRGQLTPYVSRRTLARVIGDPDITLEAERRQLTVVSASLVGFGQHTEPWPAAQAATLLMECRAPLIESVLDGGGTLDHHTADGVAAFFGAPIADGNPAAQACLAVLHLRDALDELADSWSKRGLPALRIGVGLHTATMVVGCLGSGRLFHYGIVGAESGVGQQLMKLAPSYGVVALLSESTLRAAGEGFHFREVDRVRVPGQMEPWSLFELLGTAESARDNVPFLEAFASGIEAYRGSDFPKAESSFLAAAAMSPSDGPTRVYLERIQHFKANPPPKSWDGVSVLAAG